ncbi:unnamed protein product [Caenorhabditis brenneri]
MGRRRVSNSEKRIKDIEKRNKSGESRLMRAAMSRGSMEEFDDLLRNGADIHSVDNAGNTILSVAIIELQTEKIGKLLRNGALVEKKSGVERNRMIHDVLHKMFSTPEQEDIERPEIRKEVLKVFKLAMKWNARMDVENSAGETGLSLLEKLEKLIEGKDKKDGKEVNRMRRYYTEKRFPHIAKQIKKRVHVEETLMEMDVQETEKDELRMNEDQDHNHSENTTEIEIDEELNMNVQENKEINQETQFSNSDDSGVECLCVSEMTIPNSYTSHEEQSIITEPSSSFIMETQAVDEKQQDIPSYGTAILTEGMLEDRDNDLNDTTKTQPLSNKEEKQIDFELYKDPLRPQLIPATDTFWFQECKNYECDQCHTHHFGFCENIQDRVNQ